MADSDPKDTTIRSDGWENVLTGFGVQGKDKRLGSTFTVGLLAQRQCEEIWRGDDMAARIIEVPVDEMLREGFDICIENDKDLSEEMETELYRLDAIEKARLAMYYARAYGGGALLIGAEDGGAWSEPLAEDRIRSLDWLTVLSPEELQAREWYGKPNTPKYGQVAMYQLTPIGAPPGNGEFKMPMIHESRIIRFDGNFVSRRQRYMGPNPGWDDPMLVRLVQIINDFQSAWQGAAILLQDFSIPVLKIKGLAQAIAGRNPSNTSIAARAAALELCRSIARVALVDADQEDFGRHTTPVTGLAELLDKLMLRLAAAADMPVSRLMGQAPAGLNATGDSDIRWFYDHISTRRERLLRPALKRLIDLIFKNFSGPAKGKPPENWDLKFKPLWQLTETEQADLRNKQAQTDKLYIDSQVVTAPEIAKSRFGGDAYSTETQVDMDIREELLSDEEHMGSQLGLQTEHESAMQEANLAQAQNAAKAPPFPKKG